MNANPSSIAESMGGKLTRDRSSPRAFVVFAVTALAACSSNRTGVSAGACNDLVHDGSAHSVALASNPAPAPVGGTISEGSYVLTTARLFNVPGTIDIKRQLGVSLVIRGDMIEQVTHVDGAVERSTFEFTASSTTLSLVDTCTESSAAIHGFSATPTQLDTFTQEAGTPYTLHRIFTKR